MCQKHELSVTIATRSNKPYAMSLAHARRFEERAVKTDLRVHHHVHGHRRQQVAEAALLHESAQEGAVLQLGGNPRLNTA
jgi:hypothetical protein